MDPQHRVLLETVYESLETAGLPIESLQGTNTGVYVGVMCNDYEAMLLRDFQSIPTYHATGIARSILSNRISYFFDWHGPSMTIDTACSSSLVAVHLAVQALRAGDSHVALACGSNLLLGPENYVAESKLKMLSPDGRSRMWDQDANGYARGDGVAAIVLKTLSNALADGDHIECVIRETSVNQDGRTKGITMPSAAAQEALIRETYTKAGLDPRNPVDRCQYFEAHGTGTPAGDPIEAEAIRNAFFGGKEGMSVKETTGPLYVGSIKTVIGHTEGTAGLAAVLKASLALQKGIIPPNLLFNRLNPSLLPFYDHLEIPTKALEWPELPQGGSRRASVNSFGFGGANAHAILEGFDYKCPPVRTTPTDTTPLGPFVFSANSEQSLIASLEAYSKHLNTHPEINARDLAWTLRPRRSTLPIRIAFPATSTESLQANIDDKLTSLGSTQSGVGTRSILSSNNPKPRILGIFTGQGAQYARMGADLIEKSHHASSIIDSLEFRLSLLPESDRPTWSLRAELLADASTSRVGEASISQPLCTAVQVMLVETLRLAGIQLTAVVGHSSGEIGAAFAAGYLSAHDAICIAYYRGLHSKHAIGRDGVKGAMLAVGTSLEDAQDLCDMEELQGRVVVAASNSPSSVTLSGDEDAIAEVEAILEDERKFRRLLKVDKAYHSHHMRRCSEKYLKSLRECEIQVLEPSLDCKWISSVYGDPSVDITCHLNAKYWDDNMVRPVLFSQAINLALETNTFDIAIELGPHPALKGPATQTIQDRLQQSIPYTGLLSRGKNAVEAMSTALGFLWEHLDKSAVDLDKYENEMSGRKDYHLIKHLPSYQWQHDRAYWAESRLSRKMRERKHRVHPLLGDLCPDSSTHQMQWRNLLRPSEISWLRGHQLQNQTVFPAAGYVATALEAAQFLTDQSTSIQMLEVRDFIIHQAMVFEEDDPGIEVLFSINDIQRQTGNRITTKFTYSSAVGKERETLSLMANGELELVLGDALPTLLPGRSSAEPNMIDVDADRFYASLEEIGYGYTGPFRALSALKRKLGKASGLLSVTPSESTEGALLVHPAMLDAAIQSVILAYSYPNDGRLWSLHVPTKIQRIRVNPALCLQFADAEAVSFESSLVNEDKPGVFGDIDIYDRNYQRVAIQVEGMNAVPFAGATPADDKKIFSAMRWSTAEPDADAVAIDSRATDEDYQLAYVLERISSFYLRGLDSEIPSDHPGRSQHAFKAYLNYAAHVNNLVASGEHPYAKQEWVNDTMEDIMTASER